MQPERARRMTATAGRALAPGTAVLAAATAARATEGPDQAVGKAEPWQMGLQDAATPVMEQVHAFHDLLLVIITGIVVFVAALLLYTAFRFRESRNPTPSGTAHNTLLEIAWTVVPVVILVVIAIPSFKLLYYQDQVVDSELTVKAIGRQWYWSYAYPDHGNFSYNSILKQDDNLAEDEYRQLSATKPRVLPASALRRLLAPPARLSRAQALVYHVHRQAEAAVDLAREALCAQRHRAGSAVRLFRAANDHRVRLPGVDQGADGLPVWRAFCRARQCLQRAGVAGDGLPYGNADAPAAVVEAQDGHAWPASDDSRVISTPRSEAAACQRSGVLRLKMISGSAGPFSQAFCASSCSSWPASQPA